MQDIKLDDVILSPSEQSVIREIASHWDERHQMVDWREPKCEVSSLLYHKLARLGAGEINQPRNRILVFENRIRELVERFDHALREERNTDQWAKAARWIRSKKWSFPIMLVVVGLPLIVDYCKMLIWLIEYVLTGSSSSK